MSLNCEKIINENEKLKLSDLEKSCINTFEYLNLHHNVNFLKIKAVSKENEFIFFDNINHDLKLIDILKFKQNCDTDILFEFYASDDENNNIVKSHLNSIKFSLQVFSQSIFNKYMEKTIDELSLVDHITGAYNRCYLQNYIQAIFSLANREQKKVAFVKIAIDQFKAVIDEFDYSTGDKVLKTLSSSLKKSVRESDIVIKISNDEFLVILMNIINEENATIASQKLINNFSEEKVVVNEATNQVLMKTICTGISIYPDDATTLDEILKKSDIALYEAQNRGRGQVFKFTEEETHTIDFF
jgi:diguanylate cyclase (GGDEF)-like protein